MAAASPRRVILTLAEPSDTIHKRQCPGLRTAGARDRDAVILIFAREVSVISTLLGLLGFGQFIVSFLLIGEQTVDLFFH